MSNWNNKRTKPYTAQGIEKVPCIRCGSLAYHQWQVCADNRYFRPLCLKCDHALNRLVLKWAGDPNWKEKCEKYEKKL